MSISLATLLVGLWRLILLDYKYVTTWPLLIYIADEMIILTLDNATLPCDILAPTLNVFVSISQMRQSLGERHDEDQLSDWTSLIIKCFSFSFSQLYVVPQMTEPDSLQNASPENLQS